MSANRRISIRDGRLIDPANGIDERLDLHVEDGKILAVGPAPTGFRADATLSAEGLVVCPGLIDLSARLREPGQEHKATISSETRAAAGGGITTLCCPPDTAPAIDTPAVAQLIRQRAEHPARARVLPIGAMTRGLSGDQLSEMAALRDAGCIAVSNAGRPFKNTLVKRRALEYASTFGMTCIIHPLNHSLMDKGCAHEGRVSTRLGLPGIPEAAETVALAGDLALVEQIGARVHIHALSSARSARMFGRAHYDSPHLSADVAIHHLLLTDEDIDEFDGNCHVIPPLRAAKDRDALRKAVADGVIEAVCSDHQPHEPDAKTNPFPTTEPGMSGLDTLLPLMLRLVDEGVMDLRSAIERLTWGPANVLGLPYGRLDPGRDADICLFDPDEEWILSRETMLSRGSNTPFLGQTFKGRVVRTLLGGIEVFSRDR